MSLFKRRHFIALTVAALSGCGFTPVYAPDSAASALKDNIDIQTPTDRESYTLYDHLSLKFGQNSAGQYKLSYDIDTEQKSVGITQDQETTRYHVTGSIEYALSDAMTNAVITDGKVSSFTAYSATGSTVSAITAPRDAHARLMTLLGDQIITRIAAQVGP